jgi:serine/threonine protein kinase
LLLMLAAVWRKLSRRGIAKEKWRVGKTAVGETEMIKVQEKEGTTKISNPMRVLSSTEAKSKQTNAENDLDISQTRAALAKGGAWKWREVRASDITSLAPIGKGGFGDVSKVTCGGVIMAKKELRCSTCVEEEKNRKYLAKEARAMAACLHPNIIRLLGVCIEPGELCLLVEFAELGSLREKLDIGLDMPAWRRFDILRGVALGMKHLHAHLPRAILHHDLKALNILLVIDPATGDWVPKIADFGLATGSGGLSSKSTCIASAAGTISHSPPEVINNDPFTAAADVYGFAMIVYETVTGNPPFEGMPQMALMNMVVNKSRRPTFSLSPFHEFSEGQWQFIATLIPGGGEDGTPPGGCWAQDPRHRPAFVQIVGEIRTAAARFKAPAEARLRARGTSMELRRKFLANQEEILAGLATARKEGQLMHSQEMNAIAEAAWVKTPTCFIIVPQLLEHESASEQIQLAADGSGFELKPASSGGAGPTTGEDVLDKANALLKKAEAGKRWLDKISKVGRALAEGSFGDAFKAAVDELVTEESLYFYLLDEETGDPVVPQGKSPYPIKITKPKQSVPKLLPLLSLGLKAMKAVNGVAGIGRAFGLPLPAIPESWGSVVSDAVDALGRDSSVVHYGALQSRLDNAAAGESTVAKGVRGTALRQLEQFLGEHDEKKDWAGLQQGQRPNGDIFWSLMPA